MLILYPDFPGTDALSQTWSVGTETDLSGYTVLTKLPSSLFIAIGNKVQLTLQSPTAGGTLNGIYISDAASSGNAYDSDTAPVNITFEGSTSLTMDAGTEYVSDWVDFPFFISPKIVAFNMGSMTNAVAGYLAGATSYTLTTVQEADDTIRTASYDALKDTLYFLTNIQVST